MLLILFQLFVWNANKHFVDSLFFWLTEIIKIITKNKNSQFLGTISNVSLQLWSVKINCKVLFEIQMNPFYLSAKSEKVRVNISTIPGKKNIAETSDHWLRSKTGNWLFRTPGGNFQFPWSVMWDWWMLHSRLCQVSCKKKN